jgi:NAD(P)-dependent dehydrogenase (short-subunit alcohol dehydrogenase family)
MGKGAALRLAEAGANLAIVDLNQEAGEQMVRELSEKHGNQKFIVCFFIPDISSSLNA